MGSLVLSIVLSALRFQGDWVCPTPALVQQQLAKLSVPNQGTHVIELREVAGHVELRLVDESGAVLARRELPVDARCDRMAQVIAVLIAAWESEIGARVPESAAGDSVVATLGASPSKASSTTPPIGTPVPSPPPVAPSVPSPAPAASPQTGATMAKSEDSNPASQRLEWRLGLGVLGSWADYEPAIGALFFASLQPSGSRFEGHARAFFATPRTLALGPGTIS